LAYNKDMQEDKEAIFDAVDTVKLCLITFTPMFRTMKVLKENMRKAAAKGFINATDCADYLVKKGMPFRSAYKAVGSIVARCIELDITLEALPIEEYRRLSKLFEMGIYKAIALDTCVINRNVEGGPAPEAVAKQVERLKTKLADIKA
ncbi:MAG: argininosuccinate lyase, partial [Oscillospiraceae bacterium]|nr:argininosuccinate lyase [Oscillospiraceae bacterium]